MKKIILICCFCFGFALNAQEFEIGVILDSLPISNGNNETFALYLPPSYKPSELSPILFIFSPSGNGKNAIRVFQKAAETFNYILVCSNDSRNGPHNRNFRIAERLFNHVFANFNIAENRIYLAGFSGGSRLATSIATVTGQIQGVVACGAGFSSTPAYRPSTQDFSYAAICGDRDMNFLEMLNVSEYLHQLNFQNTLFTFDGNHRWPPNEQILKAFDWLEMQAQKKGYLKKTKDEIRTSYFDNLALAKQATENNQPLLAVERNERIIETYSPFINLDSVRRELNNIKKSKSYTSALKSREKAFDKETELSSRLFNRFMQDFGEPEKANLKWWDKELEKLDKVSKGDSEMEKMLERLQYNLFAAAYEKSTLDFNHAGVKQKEFCAEIISRIRSRLKN